MTADMVIAANDELLGLVDARLPERFYRGERHWRPLGTALIARIAGIVRSMSALATAGQQNDSLILLRVLYDHVLMFCWIAIDPHERIYEWRENAVIQRRKLHNDALMFGLNLMSDEQLEEAAELEEFKHGPIERADEVDVYWSERIPGIRPPTKGSDKGLLTFRGLYTGIYRVASRTAHAQIETIDDCIDLSSYPGRPAVVFAERDDSVHWSALSTPLFAIALLICNYRLGWPDEEVVRRINDGLGRLPDDGGRA